jgi:hypothetical protein
MHLRFSGISGPCKTAFCSVLGADEDGGPDDAGGGDAVVVVLLLLLSFAVCSIPTEVLLGDPVMVVYLYIICHRANGLAQVKLIHWPARAHM